MAGSMKQFRKFIGPNLDAIFDQLRRAVRQAGKGARAGSSYHVTVQERIGLSGDVTHDDEDSWDVVIRPTVGGLAGGTVGVEGEGGYANQATSSFMGAGNIELTLSVKVVNAEALAAGVDADVTP